MKQSASIAEFITLLTVNWKDNLQEEYYYFRHLHT